MTVLLLGVAALLVAFPDAGQRARAGEAAAGGDLENSPSRLSDEPIPLQPIPDASPLLVEWPDKFLKVGELGDGFELPTGAVWRPTLWIWGNYRTSVQIFNNQRGPQSERSEWAQRLDLFGQVNLSGTERLVIGIRPFDDEHRTGAPRREFTSYDFREEDFVDAWNADITTLFFEGDLGEIFPNLDPDDTGFLDYGFSVGRQALTVQDGLLLAENSLDAVTVTRNTVYGSGILNLRATGLVAWDEIDRSDNSFDDKASMVGFLTETDLSFSTISLDGVYLDSRDSADSAFYLGASGVQRVPLFGQTFNTSLHVLGSLPTSNDPNAVAENGALLFSQISHTPHHTHDLVYLNAFWAIDDFTSAARSPGFGGPLGLTGITFASVGLGSYGSPLSNQASRAAGGGLGYQFIFDEARKQLILELGARKDTNDINEGETALAARYQQALWKHFIVRVEGFFGAREGENDLLGGARTEFQIKF